MANKSDRLITISSAPISIEEPYLDDLNIDLSENIRSELRSMLKSKNGFYAFESALHFFPAASSESCAEMTLNKWNNISLWKSEYGEEIGSYLCFSEDIFGIQFCMRNNSIFSFDPETGEFEEMCNSLEDWASLMIEDYEVLTGFPVAHEWQAKHGKIKLNERLLPKTPFVCGGEFTVENLYSADASQGMRFRAQIAKQIKDLPDGSTIKFVVR